ncbi:hypothetical protein Peur_028097 [Populus x canadensis]
MDLPLKSVLGASKIVGSISSLLFLVVVDSGVEAGSIFVVDSGVAAGLVICTTVAAEFDFILSVSKIIGYISRLLFLIATESGVATGNIACTTIVNNPGITTSWVVYTIIAAESEVATSGIFLAESGLQLATYLLLILVLGLAAWSAFPFHF